MRNEMYRLFGRIYQNYKGSQNEQNKKLTNQRLKKTGYCYDDRSFRLNVLRTTRNNGQDTLQDLNYYYDAVGNIVGEADHAQQIFYFANQEVEPVFNYTYDPVVYDSMFF